MKTIKFFLLFYFFIINVGYGKFLPFWRNAKSGSNPVFVKISDYSEEGFILEFVISGMYVEEKDVDGNAYYVTEINKEGTLREVGEPQLPVISRAIAIPSADKINAEIIDKETIKIKNFNIYPFQKKPSRCDEWQKIPFILKKEVYQREAFYPEKIFSISPIWRLRDVDFSILTIYPVQFSPQRKELLVHRKIKLYIDFKTPSALNKKIIATSHSFWNIYRLFFINSFFIEFSKKPYDTLTIITYDDFVDSLKSFAEWKNKSGIQTKIVPISEIGQTNDKIKSYIKNAYEGEDVKPTFFLLVGDEVKIPTNMGCLMNDCASDFIYSQMDEDLFSDVIVARISGKTKEEIELQVKKVIYYESTPPQEEEAEWLEGATCISSSEGEGGSNDDYRSDIIAKIHSDYGYKVVDKFYHSQGNDTVENISAALNEGRGYLTYLGHGSGTSWVTTIPPFSNEHIDALKNYFKIPVIMDVSCSNGGFIGEGDCLAERWLKSNDSGTPKGGIAIYSSSTPTSWDEPAEMAIGVVSALLTKGIHRWGEITLYGRVYLTEKMGTGENIKNVFEQYVVFGDPSLLIRTKIPKTLTVLHDPVIPVGEAQFSIVIKDGANVVAGAFISLKKEGEFNLIAISDEKGEATFDLYSQTPAEAVLTVNAFDFNPYEEKIPVVATGCGLLKINSSKYNCNAKVHIKLWDSDLNLNEEALDTAEVKIITESNPQGSIVELKETDKNSSLFQGEYSLIGVKHGENLKIQYHDSDCNEIEKDVEVDAMIDCLPPVFSEVKVEGITHNYAKVLWKTDEFSDSMVKFGQKSVDEFSTYSKVLITEHIIELKWLEENTEYIFDVVSVDEAENQGIDNNMGMHYKFKTLPCTPSCEGKECGDNGCGGVCGTCEPLQKCLDGKCTGGAGCEAKNTPTCDGCKCEKCVCNKDHYCCDTAWDAICVEECISDCGGCGAACIPFCEGKECGDNGCDGICGFCDAGYECIEGKCVKKEYCGDGICNADSKENCMTCSVDCPCPKDEICITNGHCCKPQCEDKECGNDGCGSVCGKCKEGFLCNKKGKCEHQFIEEGVSEIKTEEDVFEKKFEVSVIEEIESETEPTGCGCKIQSRPQMTPFSLIIFIALSLFFVQKKSWRHLLNPQSKYRTKD